MSGFGTFLVASGGSDDEEDVHEQVDDVQI